MPSLPDGDCKCEFVLVDSEVAQAHEQGRQAGIDKAIEVVARHWHRVASATYEDGVVLDAVWNEAMQTIDKSLAALKVLKYTKEESKRRIKE